MHSRNNWGITISQLLCNSKQDDILFHIDRNSIQLKSNKAKPVNSLCCVLLVWQHSPTLQAAAVHWKFLLKNMFSSNDKLCARREGAKLFLSHQKSQRIYCSPYFSFLFCLSLSQTLLLSLPQPCFDRKWLFYPVRCSRNSLYDVSVTVINGR